MDDEPGDDRASLALVGIVIAAISGLMVGVAATLACRYFGVF